MSRCVRNRQVRRIGLTALVVVLGVGVWQGVAGATSAKGKTAKIQRHNSNCGRHAGSRAIGTATFSRDGDTTLDVDVNLTSADPNTNYFVELWMATNGGDCEFVTDMGPLNTDGAGQGSGEYSAGVDNKKHNYFVDVTLSDGGAPTHSQNGDETDGDDNDSLFIRI